LYVSNEKAKLTALKFQKFLRLRHSFEEEKKL
jgi:hypothetical protein